MAKVESPLFAPLKQRFHSELIKLNLTVLFDDKPTRKVLASLAHRILEKVAEEETTYISNDEAAALVDTVIESVTFTEKVKN
jgi:hypothetical protein